MTKYRLNDTVDFIARHNTELTRGQIRGFLFAMAQGNLDGMRVSTANEKLSVAYATTSATGHWFEIGAVGVLACPTCDKPLDPRGPFDGTEESTGVAFGHEGFGDTFLCDEGHWFALIQDALIPAERILTVVEI